MPITETTGYLVECDVCHSHLVIPDGSNAPNRLQVALFLTKRHAKSQATYMGWTLGRDLVACPNCSPLTTPSRTPTSADAGAGYAFKT